MKKYIFGFLLSMCAMQTSYSVIIDNSTPIPDANVLINFNKSGLDWVYAGPIAPNEWGLGAIYYPSYRASEGWRVATAAEWLDRPQWTDFIAPGNPGNISIASTFSNHTYYIFASEYWGDFRHVDAADLAAGRVTDGVNGAFSAYVPETIYVRYSASAPQPVPEPTTLALLGMGLAGLGFKRRRRAS